MECNNEGKIVKYIGETGRGMKERRVNHEEDARSKKNHEKSHMECHRRERHPEEEKIKFEIQSYKEDTLGYVQTNC